MSLRAVAPDEVAPPKSVTEAAARGTKRELLVAMRDRIAKTVEDPKCPPRDLASLSLRLTHIAEAIESLDLIEIEGGGDGQPAPDEEFNPVAAN